MTLNFNECKKCFTIKEKQNRYVTGFNISYI